LQKGAGRGLLACQAECRKNGHQGGPGIPIYLQVFIKLFGMAILAGIALTAVGSVLLSRLLKGCIWPNKKAHETGAQIIEIDEYEILDDNPDPAPQGYKIEIHDSNI